MRQINFSSGADTFNRTLVRDHDNLIINDGPFTFIRSGPEGRVSAIQDGILSIAFVYDNLARMTSRTHTVNGQIIYRIQFGYDAVGRLLQKVETAYGTTHTFSYAYDVDGQLTGVNRDGVPFEIYAYDLNGNRVSAQVGGGPVEAATYNAQDQLVLNGTISYQYDADGFMVRRGTNTFQYSARGELLQATVGGQTVSYAYDGLHRRIARTDSAGIYQYFYGNQQNSLQISAGRDPNGILSSFYYDDWGYLYAIERGGTVFYVATDQVGSPRVVSDSSGNVVRIIEYNSYGSLLSDSNPGFGLPIGFAGGLSDAITDLVRFGFRDYDSSAGRWAARDGAFYKGRQANLYGYVNNNPINFTDPSGFFSLEGSFYAGPGGGFKFAIDKGKVSFCLEGGVGIGVGAALDPFGEGDPSGIGVLAEYGVDFGHTSFNGKIEIDGCGKLGLEAKGCVGLACEKWGLDVAMGKVDFGGEGQKGVDLKEQGKFAAKGCIQF